MKRVYFLAMILSCLGISWYMSSEAIAVDAYFDTEISTSLEVVTDTGTLLVKVIDEEVPPILQDVTYEQALYVEIIFDASQTMEEPDINGIRKIDIAKTLVSILVNYFPQRDTYFGLRVNGAKSPNNCLDSEFMVPFSRGNGQQVLDAVRNIQPTGLSPLVYSLRHVLQDFEKAPGTKIVFMITDGQETCDIEPVDACTTTMDMLLLQAEFEGSINILGVNTVYDNARTLLECLTDRGRGKFLDSNRNSGRELAQLIRESSQLRYNISRILDIDTLSEGKILGLINRRIGDSTELKADSGATAGQGTNVLIEAGIIQQDTGTGEIREINVKESSAASNLGYSTHELPPGVYKIEFITTPALISYFTIDEQQEFTVGVVRSGQGFDLYDRAHLALGNRYYDNGQIEQAVAEYQKVLDFDPRNVNAHLNMGIIYHDILQDNDKAAFHYKTYLELQGPRQEEVSIWLREVRGLPSEEEELQEKLKEIEEQKAREEAARLAAEEQAQRERERQKALDAYNEIRATNSAIRELSEEAVIAGEPLDVFVSLTTTDSKAEKIALDVGGRMLSLLSQHPDITVYREDKLDVPIARASYDESQQQYVLRE